jgi:MATE family multidrug resistance protein
MARLAGPVVVVQLGLLAMGAVDTIMVGRVSAEALAAVALGHIMYFFVNIFGLGSLMALDPLVSQAVGSGDHHGIRRSVQRGLVLSVALSLPISLLLLPGELVLGLLQQPEEVTPLAAQYVRISIPGVVPLMGFVVFRQTLQAMERLRPVVVAIVIANLANVLLDWLLVFGPGPFPALGALGSAWASTVCRWLMALTVLVAARHELAPLLRAVDREALRLAPLLRMLRLGAPIGLQLQFELAAFSVVALLMGWLGPQEMAAHQIAINLAALTYMVPVGVSAAAAVRVGSQVGAGSLDGCRRAASAALLIGVAFMSVSAVGFLTLPELLARAYTDKLEVLRLAALLIPIAGFFQVFDALQVVSAGVLRGLGDTRTPLVVNMVGFWLVGLPVSILLGFSANLGPQGLWWGLVVGLGAVAAILLVRVVARLRHPVARLQLE